MSSPEGRGPAAGLSSIDTTDLGKYFFEVIDRASNRVIYSRGFASIYGEWETTPEFRSDRSHLSRVGSISMAGRAGSRRHQASAIARTCSSRSGNSTSIRTPCAGRCHERGAGRYVHVSLHVIESGPPSRKVDLLLISDGYSSAQASKFRADAARLVRALFALEPFKSRRERFQRQGAARARHAVSVEFNIFGLERYALTDDNRALRDVAAAAPYDVVEILVNDKKYGGGGIFNQQSTVAAANAAAEYVFIHELAHNLAGLGDEYVGTVTYETGALEKVEPWEPNITALHDPSALKWRDLVEPGTPVPTPMSYAGKVGAFEGAGYEARGLYRPEAACIMGSRKTVTFCRVCQRAIQSHHRSAHQLTLSFLIPAQRRSDAETLLKRILCVFASWR